MERIAGALGVTKGSFYWHFEDRDELLDRLLDAWEFECTDRIGSCVGDLSGNPAQQLWALLELVTEADTHRCDAAVRAWALHDPRAAARVRRVDARRLELLRNIFLRMGLSAAQAEMRSRLSYCCMVGESLVFEDGLSDEVRLELVGLRHRFLACLDCGTGWNGRPDGATM